MRPPLSKSVRPTVEQDTTLAEVTALDALLSAIRYDPKEVVPAALVSEDQLAAEVALLDGSLREFVKHAWKLVEPSTFVPNWHIDSICEHLEAVTAGDIQDLLVTMPPRHSKSLIITVLWPVWEWSKIPSYRWVFASYAFALSVRDSIKRRKIIQSQWFHDRYYDRFALIPEQNTKIRYENDRHGFMLASSVGGSNTGEGGERIIADDPHNIKKSESEDVRTDTVNWWNIVMSTRRNDLKHSARVVVQQRTHEGDVAGDIIERGGYVHLNLPTEFMFAGAPRCQTQWVVKATGETHTWEDPRQEAGELLNPLRFDAEANEKAKLELGDYQYAAQHGQNPTPPSGSIVQAQWLKYYGGIGQPPIPDWKQATHNFTPLFSLDCTFKEHKDTDFVAGLGWVMFGADIYLMPIKIHKRMNFPDTLDAVAEFVGGKSLDETKEFPGIYPFMKIKLVEDKANGSAILDTLRHRIPGMVAYQPGNASKESRLASCSWRFRAGNVYLPHESIAPWVIEYRYQLCAFPKARHDDYVDATSQALLFIGGDQQVSGEPISTPHVSTWITIDSSDLSESSAWGTPSQRGNRSIWR